MTRVLITGIRGFTGIHAQRALEASGYEVVGLGKAPPSGEGHYWQVDLADADGIKTAVDEIRPDLVLHLAAIASVTHADPADFYRVNVIGTRHLLSALAGAHHPVAKVILASSGTVYGLDKTGVLDEADPANPPNDYAVSKYAMELMARLWMPRLPLILARTFNYTGIGQSEAFLVPKIIAHVAQGKSTIRLGNVDVSREFADVRDVAGIYKDLLEQDEVGTLVNLCTGEAYTIRHLIETCERLTGHRIAIEVDPALVRTNDPKLICGNPSKLWRMIGKQSPRSLDDTLSWMLGRGP